MIIFDLEGILANCEHRRHFILPTHQTSYIFTDSIPNENGYILTGEYRFKDGNKWKPDWKSFYEACGEDEPIEAVIEIYNSLHDSESALIPNIEIWSGRCESVRRKTISWFVDYEIYIGNHPLKMRPIGDTTPLEKLKERWLDEAEAQGKKIDFVFDADFHSMNMFRHRGIFVFDVNQGGLGF